jgi:transposase
MTITKVSKEMKLDRRTVKKYSNTTIVNKKGRTKKHNTKVEEYLENLLQENSGLFLKEMQQKLTEDLRFNKSISTVHKILTNMRFSRKKATKIAFYRTIERVQNLRASFRAMIQNFHPYNFIYIDESSFDFHYQTVKELILTFPQRNYGYSKVSNKAIIALDKVDSKHYSLLAAMSAFEIIHYEIIDTSKSGITTVKFTDFFLNLISLVGSNSKLLLDNAKIYKVNTVLALLDHFQIEYLFFSSYSPDYNVIEYLFRYIKQQIKNYPELELTEAMRKVITSIEFDEEKLQSWINYAASHWESDAL